MNFNTPGYPAAPPGFAPNPQQAPAPLPQQGYGAPPGYPPQGAPLQAPPPGYGPPPGYPAQQPAPMGYAPPQPPQGYQPPPGYQAPQQGSGLPNFAGADTTELSMRTDGIPIGDHHLGCRGATVTDTLMIITFVVKQSSTLQPGAVVALKQNKIIPNQYGGDKTRDAALLSCVLPLAGWSVEDTPESKAKLAQLGAQGYKSRALAEVFGAGTLEGRPLDQFEVYCKATPKPPNPNKPVDPTKPPFPNLKFIPVNPR